MLPRALATRSRRAGVSLFLKRWTTSLQASSASCGRFRSPRTAPLLLRAVATETRRAGFRSSRNDGPPRHRPPARPAAGSDAPRTTPLFTRALRNPLEKGRGLALPETTDHLVIGFQRVLRPVQLRRGRPLCSPRAVATRLKEGRESYALPETTDHLIAGLQRVLRPVQRAEGDPLCSRGRPQLDSRRAGVSVFLKRRTTSS